MSTWTVYIVRCADDTLYTGITNDLERRILEHNSQKGGARYTRARRPVTLIYCEYQTDRSTASKREHHIKQLSRAEKLGLISTAAL